MFVKNKPRTDWDSTYVPHGINEKYFYPVKNEKERLEMNKMKSELFKGKDIDFVYSTTIETSEER